MTQQKNILGIVAFAMVCFIVVSILIFKKETANATPPIVGQVQDFTLTDSNGKQFGLKDLNGKIWIADFIFTTCGGICPSMSKNMAQLHRSFVLVEGVELVSISVNPEQDSPKALSVYASRYGADTNKWHFLTGRREAIQKLAVESFKLGKVDEPIFHSAKFVLVDRQGRIRGYYEGADRQEIDKLFKDTAFLFKNKGL